MQDRAQPRFSVLPSSSDTPGPHYSRIGIIGVAKRPNNRTHTPCSRYALHRLPRLQLFTRPQCLPVFRPNRDAVKPHMRHKASFVSEFTDNFVRTVRRASRFAE